MRRADRLFEIIQLLRHATGPVTAHRIAAKLETSKRPIYRDIDALVGQRMPIRGEAGICYVLDAALNVLAKVTAIVPEHLPALVDDPAFGTPPRKARDGDHVDVARFRLWCGEGRTLEIEYRDENGRPSKWTIWPFMAGYVTAVRIVAAWCELRRDFRIFRTDRLIAIGYLDQHYPDRPDVLRGRWLKMMRDKHALSGEANAMS